MANRDMQLLLGAAAAYLLLRRPSAPPSQAPIVGQQGPGGFEVSGPGFQYATGPGGTRVVVDPGILQSIFGSPPSGTVVDDPGFAAPDSPVWVPDYPTFPTIFEPASDPTFADMPLQAWNPDYATDPCFFDPQNCGGAGLVSMG